MIDVLELLKDTGAYRMIKSDKENNTLSHAYLILTADQKFLSEYVNVLVRLIACGESQPCLKCRTCRLIQNNNHPDVYFYPTEGETVLTEDVNALIAETYLKPVESDKKIFVILNAQTMNASSQNKILKTLEEPPKNVHIIIGSTSEFPLLPTVMSRVKKLEIPTFTPEKIVSALKEDCPDIERLKNAVACGDGTLGRALQLYGDQTLLKLTDFAVDLLVNMKSSAEILRYQAIFNKEKFDVSDFLSVLELLLRDLLVYYQGKPELVSNSTAFEKLKRAERFNTGALLYALERITEAKKRKKFNANQQMLLDWLFFQILEGKYKWQKL